MLRIAALAVTSAVALSSPSANATSSTSANVTIERHLANHTGASKTNQSVHLEAKVNDSVGLHADVDKTAKAEKKEFQKHEESAKKASDSKAEKKDDVQVNAKSEKVDAKTPAAKPDVAAVPAAKTVTASSAYKATLEDETAHFLARRMTTPVMPDSNASKNADICSCEFRGVCGCEAAIEFMDCVSAACNSGKCDCHETQFQHACTSIAGECSSLEMECESDRAACLVEEETIAASPRPRTEEHIYAELRDLKEKSCRLELAEADGWLNAGVRLRTVRHDIDAKMSELETMKAATPEMHCEKHFEEFHMPVTPAPLKAAAFQPGAAVCLFITLLVSRMTM